MSKKSWIGMLCFAALLWMCLPGSALAGARHHQHPQARPGTTVRPSRTHGPNAFGGSLYTVSSISDLAFSPFDSGVTYNVDDSDYFKYSSNTPADFGSTVVIPAGAIIDYVGLSSCDEAGGNIELDVYRAYADGTFDTIGTITSSAHGAGTPCTVDYNGAALAYQNVENDGSNIQIDVYQMGVDDGSVRFGGVEVWWYTVVSPAPAMPTFNDVPTDHPFYQYIEALYTSGITGGCGSGNYCPDNPVTRGQMAVFLSKALGLAWPY